MNHKMQDRDLMEDLLSSEKAVTGSYNVFTNECSTAQVRDEFLNILNEEHQIHADVFSEMQKRGWYPMTNAEQQKIERAKQKFQNAKPQL